MVKKTFLGFLLALLCTANESFSFCRKLSENDLTIVREREYVGEALYGYINGGSDLYLEYGFRTLKVIDVQYKGNSYVVEVYSMPSPEDAFGIYSQHTFKCSSADSLFLFDCSSARQFQLAQGNLYISVVFDPFKGASREGASAVSGYFLSKYDNGNRPRIPANIILLLADEKASRRLKYSRGLISLGNINYAACKYFEDLANYNIWVLKESDSDIFLCSLIDEKSLEILRKRLENKDFLENDSNVPNILEVVNNKESNNFSVMFRLNK